MSLFGDLSNVVVETRGPWPVGTYPGVIVGTEVKKTRAGTGTYLEIKWQVDNKGQTRTVLQRITIENPSAKATEIGKQDAKELEDAIGQGPIQDAQWLIGKECDCYIGQEPSHNDPQKIFNIHKYNKKRVAQSQPPVAPSTPTADDDEAPF